MLFKGKNRAKELKTPKISKIHLPDSDTASFLKATTPIRRHSTASSTSTSTTTTEDSPRVMQAYTSKAAGREPSNMQTSSSMSRGGSSYKHPRVSRVPMKTYDGKVPYEDDEAQSTPKVSAISYKWSGSGDERSTSKCVNFAPDVLLTKRKGDGYCTDYGSSTAWLLETPYQRGDKELGSAKIEPPRPATRREVRLVDPQSKVPTGVLKLNLKVGANVAPTSALGDFDGYATDGEARSRAPMMTSQYRRGSASVPHISQPSCQSGWPPAEPNFCSGEQMLPATNPMRRSPPWLATQPPGLHSNLLADASGRPQVRFNIIFPPTTPYVKTWDDIPRIIKDAVLEEPATETKIKIMPIQLRCDPLPSWEYVIRRRQAVTCKDVFESIWQEYDALVTEEERAKIPRAHLNASEKGCKKRCQVVPVLTALEESRGLKRVDLLAGKTFFRGMTKPDINGPWVVELQMAPPGYSL